MEQEGKPHYQLYYLYPLSEENRTIVRNIGRYKQKIEQTHMLRLGFELIIAQTKIIPFRLLFELPRRMNYSVKS